MVWVERSVRARDLKTPRGHYAKALVYTKTLFLVAVVDETVDETPRFRNASLSNRVAVSTRRVVAKNA